MNSGHLNPYTEIEEQNMEYIDHNSEVNNTSEHTKNCLGLKEMLLSTEEQTQKYIDIIDSALKDILINLKEYIEKRSENSFNNLEFTQKRLVSFLRKITLHANNKDKLDVEACKDIDKYLKTFIKCESDMNSLNDALKFFNYSLEKINNLAKEIYNEVFTNSYASFINKNKLRSRMFFASKSENFLYKKINIELLNGQDIKFPVQKPLISITIPQKDKIIKKRSIENVVNEHFENIENSEYFVQPTPFIYYRSKMLSNNASGNLYYSPLLIISLVFLIFLLRKFK